MTQVDELQSKVLELSQSVSEASKTSEANGAAVAQLKQLALQETEAASGILSKAEQILRGVVAQRQQAPPMTKPAMTKDDETQLRRQVAQLQVGEQ